MKPEDKKLLMSKTVSSLYKDVAKGREKIAQLKKDLAFGKLKSSQDVTREKRRIAFMLTIIREKMVKEINENQNA